jgi:hypothetical protein
VAVHFSILKIMAAKPIKNLWWGGEFPAEHGGTLVEKVLAVDCEFEEVIFGSENCIS